MGKLGCLEYSGVASPLVRREGWNVAICQQLRLRRGCRQTDMNFNLTRLNKVDYSFTDAVR